MPPKTPTRTPSATPETLPQSQPPPQVFPTPQSKGISTYSGASINSTQDAYAPYLTQDIATGEQLELDVFMNVIFNKPDWSPTNLAAINHILNDSKFQKRVADYPEFGDETGYYQPFVELANQILESDGHDRIAFCRNDPKKIAGSFGERSPDVIAALMEAIFNPQRMSSDHCAETGPEHYPFHWADLIAFVEFKKTDAVLKSSTPSGSSVSSRVRTHTPPSRTQPSRSAKKQGSGSAISSGKKRSATSHSDSAHKRVKIGQVDTKVQCASYALEMLSNGGLRTHVLGLCIFRRKVHLLYYDRSIFISSKEFDFIKEHTRFVALLLILVGLSYKEWGFIPGFEPPFTILDLDSGRSPSKNLFSKKSLKLLDGSKLVFGEILSRHHGLIGRGTCVIHASVAPPRKDWPTVVAVKISSPAKGRKSETDIVEAVRKKAEAEGATWVLQHLPEILAHQDLDLDENSPRHRLNEFFRDKPGVYELRALRLLVFHELQPITQLKTATELAKAFRGIFNCYRWVYEKAGLLHRDISLYNLMYYRKEGEVFGVLNDFDLATFIGDRSPSSKQRTGTKPFMAYQLLEKEGVFHRYRHDLESLFYVIVILTSHFENGEEISDPPLQDWFSVASKELALAKYRLLTGPIDAWPSLTAPYTGFTKWVDPISFAFAQGNMWMRANKTDGNDSDTLGGHVTFEKMADIFDIDVTTE